MAQKREQPKLLNRVHLSSHPWLLCRAAIDFFLRLQVDRNSCARACSIAVVVASPIE
jgi:hypothetical protein